jgi:hypothetical protein
MLDAEKKARDFHVRNIAALEVAIEVFEDTDVVISNLLKRIGCLEEATKTKKKENET